jgi:hypothetical protein
MNTLSSSDTDQTRTEAVLTAHDCDWSIDPDWSDELQNVIWTRTQHTNRLRSALREYYPAALVAFEDLAHGDALGCWAAPPAPSRAPT